tara:strand:- start:274 stop:1254 length:981 start_codon:yes stop_codon:yes gene_type:complete
MTDIHDIKKFRTNHPLDDMIEDKRVNSELLKIYNQVSDKHDIKRFILMYLSNKCPINIEILPPEPMDTTIEPLYNNIPESERGAFRDQHNQFKYSIPNHKVYIDLVDLYEYEVGMEHKQAITLVTHSITRELKDSPFVIDYNKSLTISLDCQSKSIENMLTTACATKLKVGIIYRYDPITRKTNEIKNGRKLLDIEALPDLLKRLIRTYNKGSNYHITKLKNLSKFYNIEVPDIEMNIEDIIYIISNKIYIQYNMYKIGHTTNISGRLKSFQTGHPIDMEVIYSRTLHKNIKAESILHRRYKKNQLKGEWFQIEDIQECIDFINSL